MSVFENIRYSTQTVTADRDNYWRYYGLRRDPFTAGIKDGEFLLPEHWEQKFDLLHYLCSTSKVLAVVTGAKNSGKSHFLTHFIGSFNEGVRICRLSGSATFDTKHLSEALAKNFALPAVSGETLEDQLEAQVALLQHSPELCLLVIDDAHRLPSETLRSLLFLIKQQSENQMRLHIVLAGESQLPNILTGLVENEAERELFYTVVLEAFSLKETEAYLKQRLEAAGLPAAMPFSNTVINRIHNHSAGLPGRINPIARQILISGMQQRGQLRSVFSFIRARHTKFIGASVLFLLLFLMASFIARDGQNPTHSLKLPKLFSKGSLLNFANNDVVAVPQTVVSDVKPVTLDQAEFVEQKAKNPNAQNPTPAVAPDSQESENNKNIVIPQLVSDIKPVKLHHAVFVEPKLPGAASAVASDNHKVVSKPQLQASTKNKDVVIPQVVSEIKPVTLDHAVFVEPKLPGSVPIKPPVVSMNPHHVKRPVVLASATPVKKMVALADSPPVVNEPNPVPNKKTSVAKVKSSPVKKSLPNETTKKLPMPSKRISLTEGGYTLQLVAISKKPALDEFMSKHNLDKQVYSYHLSQPGKDWYIVVYGSYRSAQEAQAAIPKLPKALRDLRPWPRPLAGVKSALHSDSDSSASASAEESVTRIPQIS